MAALEAGSFMEVAVVVIGECLDKVSDVPRYRELEAAVVCVDATDEAFEASNCLSKPPLRPRKSQQD